MNVDTLKHISPGVLGNAIRSRKWGYELPLIQTGSFRAKLLVFNGEGTATSLQYHLKKNEWMYVLQGQFHIETVKQVQGEIEKPCIVPTYLKPESVMSAYPEDGPWFSHVFIPAGALHRLTCIAPGEGVILEVSDVDDPEDTYRIEAAKIPLRERQQSPSQIYDYPAKEDE
jgi:mannose-6-phosphate isomerase-like protein (cupin superfamily)